MNNIHTIINSLDNVTPEKSARIVRMILDGYSDKAIIQSLKTKTIPPREQTLQSLNDYIGKYDQLAEYDPNMNNNHTDNNHADNDHADNGQRNNGKKKPNLPKYNLEKIFGLSLYKSRKLFNETSLYTYRYVSLDTSNSTGYDFVARKYKWNYNGTPVVQDGTASSTGPIKNIIGMRVFPIVMKEFLGFRDLYNIYTLTIDELISQSFIGHEKQRYHFMFRVKNYPVVGVSNWIEFNPHDFNRGYFWFKTPIQNISTFTISMANPVQAVDIPAGIQTCDVTHNNPLELTFTYPHGIISGNTVFITGFTTDDPVTDAAIIAAINSTAGHIATSVDTFNITIPIDGTLVTAPKINIFVNCRDSNNKTLFMFEFICEKEEIPGDDSFL